MELPMSISAGDDEKTFTEDENAMACRPVEPSAFLRDELYRLPNGRALDLACGAGRNALFLAQNAYDVDAVDFSTEALEEGRKRALDAGLKLNFIEADLESFPLPEESYDLIINFNYLERPLAPRIVEALRPGGMLLFETFTVDQRQFGLPKDEAYLLRKGELKDLFRELDILYFWEGVAEENGRKKALARLLAIKEGRGLKLPVP